MGNAVQEYTEQTEIDRLRRDVARLRKQLGEEMVQAATSYDQSVQFLQNRCSELTEMRDIAERSLGEGIRQLKARAESKRAEGNMAVANECDNCVFVLERIQSGSEQP